ncbi:MAG: glutamate/tyrosine decarboxylase-like PLP-dependent enzyme, partial [Gammaproteobacteria bacterium]
VCDMLGRCDIDSGHPRYFGLFNPPSLPITVPADALVAMLNPQVGTRTHAPAANEIEQHVLGHLAMRIGFDPDTSSAHFTSGGQEANTTAMAAALHGKFPTLSKAGIRSLDGSPRLYASALAHHSLVKAARLLGIGEDAVRSVPTGDDGRMSLDALEARIAQDRRAGNLPFLIVATAGTTSTGAIDPLIGLVQIAKNHSLWLHVDAAWGGGALMSDHLRLYLEGIEHSDSVTWDAHKWLDVPMGAGMVFFRHGRPTEQLFTVHTGYVPQSREAVAEPYQNTFQWSRRFIGLKLFMALASLSAGGYGDMIDRQALVGERLRVRLRNDGWTMVNDTPLPLVCFRCPGAQAQSLTQTNQFVERVNDGGKVWISSIEMPNGESALRVCITSFDTREDDLDMLVSELDAARAEMDIWA